MERAGPGLRNATLRQLKVFECVARHLSFTRAAQELNLTQPAVSTQVKELERHAGLPLFEQLGRKTYLTQAGEALLVHSRAIIQQFREAEEAVQQQKGVSGGRLDVAVISAGDYFFPSLLADFAALHPGVKLNLTVHNRAELLRQLADNLTDLAVMVRPPRDDETVHQAFAPHPYVIVAATTHPLARAAQVPLERLAREPFVLREHGSDTRSAMAEAFGAAMDGIDVAMEVKSTETIKQAVFAGLGLSFLSGHTVALEVAAGRLAIVDVEGFPVMRSWYVVHRRAKRLPPVAHAFKAFLLHEGAAGIARVAAFAAGIERSPSRLAPAHACEATASERVRME
jgi:DNA-binding transcriptional LysR family regulator